MSFKNEFEESEISDENKEVEFRSKWGIMY